MNIKYLAPLFSVFLFSSTAVANSVIPGKVVIDGNRVTLSTGVFEQTSTTQREFVFSFEDIPLSDGTDGILTVRARGDYSLNVGAENLGVKFDGIPVGNFGATTSSLESTFTSDDIEWQVVPQSVSNTFLIGQPFGWTDDGRIELTLTLSDEVTLDLVNSENKPYFDVALVYTTAAVPVPMGIVLFSTALFSLVTVRRKTA